MPAEIDAIEMRDVFIVGSKGIPASYGGFETFVDHLTSMKTSSKIQYHVACLRPRGGSQESDRNSIHNGARCFQVKELPIGPAKAILYDLMALSRSVRYAKLHSSERPIFYVLASRIGPFIHFYAKRVHRLGGALFVNPDGHEFLREKWSPLVRRYWKYSESLMVKHADLVVCDSVCIETYIRQEYERYRPVTAFIPYGGDPGEEGMRDDDPSLRRWQESHGVRSGEYYLVVARFVPENNFEAIIREFLGSSTHRDLVLVAGLDNPRLLRSLQRRLAFMKDERVKFVGTVYDPPLLTKIREDAYAYVHGHQVGGTNPSLLEALGTTDVSLLVDVGFNREVAEGGALYWTKDMGSLARLIEFVEGMSESDRRLLGYAARTRVMDAYNWSAVVESYERLFTDFAADGALSRTAARK